MKHSKTQQSDISMEIPTLSKQAKIQAKQNEKGYNAAPQVKKTSFAFIMVSSLVTSLSVVAVTVATAKIWRPKLFPELKKIESLEKNIIALNQKIQTLQEDTKNKELLSSELESLKQEITKTKNDLTVEMAQVNDKINSVVSEQKNNDTPQETQTALKKEATEGIRLI